MVRCISGLEELCLPCWANCKVIAHLATFAVVCWAGAHHMGHFAVVETLAGARRCAEGTVAEVVTCCRYTH